MTKSQVVPASAVFEVRRSFFLDTVSAGLPRGLSRMLREGGRFEGHPEGHAQEMVDPTNIRTADSIPQCLLTYPL